jgi:hypothetical protein
MNVCFHRAAPYANVLRPFRACKHISPERAQYVNEGQRPSAHRQRPSAHRQRPSAHRQRPSAHRQRPSAHRQRPSAHRQRPSTHRQCPAAHRRAPRHRPYLAKKVQVNVNLETMRSSPFSSF